MDSLIQVEIVILALLLVASVVAIGVRRFRIPYTVALVLVGVGLSTTAGFRVELTPRIILSLFVPPLIFEAAFHLRFDQVKQDFATIALLAVPGVIITMLLVGGVVAWGAGLSLPVAIVFGALIAATDPVAVVALFRKLGAPRRLTVLLEGESLLNDGTAIVIFELAVVAALTGSFSLGEGLLDFVRVAGGGIAVGFLLGWIVSALISRIDDHLVVTTLTTVLAFGSYLMAEDLLHLSGVLAVVTAGITAGNLVSDRMSPTTRIVVFNFWEYTAFLANSAIFLLIGQQLNLPDLLANYQTILWAIGAVLLSRAIVVYGLSRLGREIPRNWRHVLFWGGLRGAISLALALSLPEALGPDRSVITTMAFGVVFFTLVGQGISMGWVIKRFKVIFRREEQIEFERRQARALAARASFDHLEDLHDDGLISSHTWNNLRDTLKQRVDALTEAVQDALHRAPELEVQELVTARREGLRAQLSHLARLRRDGIISDETYEELVPEVDAALDSDPYLMTSDLMHLWSGESISQLLMVIVPDRHLESATFALVSRGIPATQIQSQVGLLRHPSHLLLVGIPEGRLEAAVEALKISTGNRARYVSSPGKTLGIPLPSPAPVDMDGTKIFAFRVERCEVI